MGKPEIVRDENTIPVKMIQSTKGEIDVIVNGAKKQMLIDEKYREPVAISWEEAMNLTLDRIDTPGKAYTLYMNDDNCCWIHIRLSVIETGKFFNYPADGRWDNGRTVWVDNRERELQYKAAHPNAKY